MGTVLIYLCIVKIVVFIALISHFEPMLDKTDEGWILWYNKYGRRIRDRTYKKL